MTLSNGAACSAKSGTRRTVEKSVPTGLVRDIYLMLWGVRAPIGYDFNKSTYPPSQVAMCLARVLVAV